MLRLTIIIFLTLFGLRSDSSAEIVFVDNSYVNKSVLVDLRKTISSHQKLTYNSIHFDVTSLDDPKSVHSSLLYPVEHLMKILSDAGFNSIQKFLLVGNSTSGWGEEGRLYWVLSQFFEVDVKILDGGSKAIKSRNIEKHKIVSQSVQRAALRFNKSTENHSTNLSELYKFNSPILDVRGVLEFSGATPFGSKYGGHIKGAKSVPWDQFFDGEGYLRERPLFMESLRDKNPILYCTAGYRSAMVWAVLRHYGINSKNYDGSWFEYSSQINE